MAGVLLPSAPPVSAPVIQISPMGAVGNRMIQYLAALALAARVPGVRLEKVQLAEWGIQIPPTEIDPARTATVTSPAIDLDGLAAALRDGQIDCVDLRTYAQRMENFLPPAAYRGLFGGPSAAGAGPDELLCNIRQGDILDARHPDYVLIPVAFYAELVERTGLRPVFMGQLEPTPYMDALRARFPQARFQPSGGAVADFTTVRGSRHIVPAVSTFSWLAAWLSDAERVFMPVLGLFHPLQSRATQLLPLDDSRFRFTLFPHHYAVPVAQHAAAHAAIAGLWRGMPPAQLRARLLAPSPPRDRNAYLAAFDEAFYVIRYPDIAAAILGGHMPSGRHHYEHYGFDEGREPLAIDRAWYCQTYPIAAVELGQGDALDVVDHWVTLGRERGYRRGA